MGDCPRELHECRGVSGGVAGAQMAEMVSSLGRKITDRGQIAGTAAQSIFTLVVCAACIVEVSLSLWREFVARSPQAYYSMNLASAITAPSASRK